MLTVNADRGCGSRRDERQGAGLPVVPGRLARWGERGEAAKRLPGRLDRPDGHAWLVRRRSWRRVGGVTQELLPAWCRLRRAGAGEVIGLALEVEAAGAGHRVIAGRLGCPASTVRGWLRAFTRLGRSGCGRCSPRWRRRW